MRCILPVKMIGRNSRFRNVTLILVWCLGLFAGAFAAATAGSLISLMHAYLSARVSIVSLIFVPLLPLLFSAIAVYFSYPWILYLIGFSKSFRFGLCVCAVTVAFGSAGFLIRFLLMFTDLFTLPVLCWYWIRHSDGNRANWLRDGIYCSLWCVGVAVFDYTFVYSMLKTIL